MQSRPPSHETPFPRWRTAVPALVEGRALGSLRRRATTPAREGGGFVARRRQGRGASCGLTPIGPAQLDSDRTARPGAAGSQPPKTVARVREGATPALEQCREFVAEIHLHYRGLFPCIGMSCPSWQWHRTGSRWSPVRTLPVAPLWCDLGFVPNSSGNKAAANICPNFILSPGFLRRGFAAPDAG